jgi:DNA repair exonuclease SbcCD ATPase subunit
LSSSTRIQDLESELESLRSSSSSSLDIEKLRTQLANAKRELDKLTNAKLAQEKSSKKEIDDLKSRLDDANYELEDRRREGGGAGGSNKEIESGKKEIALLKGKMQGLEEEVKARTEKVQQLETKLAKLETVGDALAEEKRRTAELQQAISTALPSSPNPDLLERINLLENQLAEARAQPLSSTSSLPAAAQIRRLERELEKIRRELVTAEEEIEKLDIENLALKANKALPGSPGSKSAMLPAVDAERVLELEMKVEELEAELLKGQEVGVETAKFKAAVEEAQKALASAKAEAEDARSRARDLENDLAVSFSYVPRDVG